MTLFTTILIKLGWHLRRRYNLAQQQSHEFFPATKKNIIPNVLLSSIWNRQWWCHSSDVRSAKNCAASGRRTSSSSSHFGSSVSSVVEGGQPSSSFLSLLFLFQSPCTPRWIGRLKWPVFCSRPVWASEVWPARRPPWVLTAWKNRQPGRGFHHKWHPLFLPSSHARIRWTWRSTMPRRHSAAKAPWRCWGPTWSSPCAPQITSWKTTWR